MIEDQKCPKNVCWYPYDCENGCCKEASNSCLSVNKGLKYKGSIMFKVYKRKIHVYCKGAPKTAPNLKQFYCWSTNAYKTCRDAVAAAKALHPNQEFTARFAKD